MKNSNDAIEKIADYFTEQASFEDLYQYFMEGQIGFLGDMSEIELENYIVEYELGEVIK